MQGTLTTECVSVDVTDDGIVLVKLLCSDDAKPSYITHWMGPLPEPPPPGADRAETCD